MMLNHLFYQNPVTFGSYIFILKKIVSSDDFIAIFQKKIVDQIAIKYRFLSKSRAIAIKRTINRDENRDKIVDFAAILMTWVISIYWKTLTQTKKKHILFFGGIYLTMRVLLLCLSQFLSNKCSSKHLHIRLQLQRTPWPNQI